MISKDRRIKNEIEHGSKISKYASKIWGWGTFAGQIRAERRANFFICLGKITEGIKVLELGCGTGIFTAKVAKTGADITAIDISPDLLEIAKDRVKDDNVKLEFKNIEAIDYSDESFDVVFGSSVLHHLDFKPVFWEIYRILKWGGRIVFTEPNMLNPQILIQKNIKFFKRIMGDSPDETAFIKWKLETDLINCGFKDVKIKTFDFLHPLTPTKLIKSIDRLGRVLEKTPLINEIAGSLLILAYKL